MTIINRTKYNPGIKLIKFQDLKSLELLNLDTAPKFKLINTQYIIDNSFNIPKKIMFFIIEEINETVSTNNIFCAPASEFISEDDARCVIKNIMTLKNNNDCYIKTSNKESFTEKYHFQKNNKKTISEKNIPGVNKYKIGDKIKIENLKIYKNYKPIPSFVGTIIKNCYDYYLVSTDYEEYVENKVLPQHYILAVYPKNINHNETKLLNIAEQESKNYKIGSLVMIQQISHWNINYKTKFIGEIIKIIPAENKNCQNKYEIKSLQSNKINGKVYKENTIWNIYHNGINHLETKKFNENYSKSSTLEDIKIGDFISVDFEDEELFYGIVSEKNNKFNKLLTIVCIGKEKINI